MPMLLALFLVSFPLLCSGARLQDVYIDAWASLNATLQGRLRKAVPFSRPCFASVFNGVTGQHNATACASVIDAYTDPTVRSDVFGSYMNTEWETCQMTSQQCLLDSGRPSNPAAFTAPQQCAQGSIPPLYIDVREPADVQAAFKFSKFSGVPLVIKNTGHDYSGRSSGANALALWMHNLQHLSYNPSFVPVGCKKSQATPGATLGAGVSQGMLYDFADAHNVMLPGGGERSVAAAGGYFQGGGHTALSNAFGLAVDRVLEVKIVTPDGRYLTANACQHADLFFAVRGGGGGTFGAVMEVTMRALPKMAFPTISVSFNATDAMQRKWLQFTAESAIKYAETGWGGYITLIPQTGLIFVNPFLSMSQAAKELESLKHFVDSVGGTFNLTLQPSFLSFFNDFLLKTGVPVGLPFVTTSRLIPADNFRIAPRRTELVDRLFPILNDSPLPLIFVVSPYFFKDDGMTSINPAWRRSLWHVTASTSWNFNTSLEQKREIYANSSARMDLLREITPGSGAYFNEADVHEPNYTASFWGENYERLVQIKRKYDPDHLLDCWQCVDSKGRNSERFSCYL